MTTPDSYPLGIDPIHVQTIATEASVVQRGDHSVLLLTGAEAIRVQLPNRFAAQAAREALQLVGYQVTGNRSYRSLLITGWSAQGLESRLDAMRGVLQKLASRPHVTAAVALGQLSRVPETELPGKVGQQHLIDQLCAGMRSWISATSGIHAPSDPRARPAEPGCALRLSATRRAEEAIDDLAARQTRVAQFVLALYPGLRQTMNHDAARESALRSAGAAFHLSPLLGQDVSPFLRRTDQEARHDTPWRQSRSPAAGPPRTGPIRPGTSLRGGVPPSGPSPSQAPPPDGSWARSARGSRRWLRAAQEFLATDRPTTWLSRPPSVPGPTRPGGRNFPSGRPRRQR